MSEVSKGASGRFVKVGAKIPFELHLAAKQIYSMQRTSIGERVEGLIRSDLKKTMKKAWFKELSEEDKAIFKFFVEAKDEG